jgi:hypothetical protein
LKAAEQAHHAKGPHEAQGTVIENTLIRGGVENALPGEGEIHDIENVVFL